MSYPLIILGAGASHGYPTEGVYAPLTNQLVDNKHLDSNLLEQYTGADDLFSEIKVKILRGKTFEEALTDFQKNTHSTVLKQQFVALQFYLKDLFEKISTKIPQEYRLNNYKSLIHKIDAFTSEIKNPQY